MRIERTSAGWLRWLVVVVVIMLLPAGALAGTAIDSQPGESPAASPTVKDWADGFNQTDFNNGPLAVAEDGAGNLYIGGAFTRVFGVEANRIVKWNGNDWLPLGQGVSSWVRDMVVAPNGDLVFFSAIDEGLVLTLAEAQDMAAHLEGELTALARDTAPAAILACDCVLRRIEAQEKQLFGKISDILGRHRVTGFSTYGEQHGAVHVNQTMTGVAIYPPKGG